MIDDRAEIPRSSSIPCYLLPATGDSGRGDVLLAGGGDVIAEVAAGLVLGPLLDELLLEEGVDRALLGLLLEEVAGLGPADLLEKFALARGELDRRRGGLLGGRRRRPSGAAAAFLAAGRAGAACRGRGGGRRGGFFLGLAGRGRRGGDGSGPASGRGSPRLRGLGRRPSSPSASWGRSPSPRPWSAPPTLPSSWASSSPP